MKNNPPGPSGSSGEGTESACGASDLAAARRELLADSSELNAAELRQACLDLHESWLTAKAADLGSVRYEGLPDRSQGYALVDGEGRLIGINTQIQSDSGGSESKSSAN